MLLKSVTVERNIKGAATCFKCFDPPLISPPKSFETTLEKTEFEMEDEMLKKKKKEQTVCVCDDDSYRRFSFE